MEKRLFVRMAAVMTLMLGVALASGGEQEVVPSERGEPRESKKSKNCQLNSLMIHPASFQQNERITAEVVVVCNHPVEKALLILRHWLGSRGDGLAQEVIPLKSGRNAVELKGRAGRGGSYQVAITMSEGSLSGSVETTPVAWTAHKARFH